MERKCDTCTMDEAIKNKNTSINDGTGSCSVCYQIKEKSEDDTKVEL